MGGEQYLINEQGSQVIKESSLCDRGLRQLCVLNQTNLRSNQPIYAGLGGKSKVQLQLSSLVEGCLGVSRASGRILPSTVPRFLYGTTVTWAYSRPRWPHWTSWPLKNLAFIHWISAYYYYYWIIFFFHKNAKYIVSAPQHSIENSIYFPVINFVHGLCSIVSAVVHFSEWLGQILQLFA